MVGDWTLWQNAQIRVRKLLLIKYLVYSIRWFLLNFMFIMARYAILSAAMIPYLGMVIRCLFKDVPVPTYRLGVEGRENFFFAVMIIMYCISYNVQDRIRLAASIICLLLILGGVSIVQLSCPIQDFTLPHILPTMYLGVMYGIFRPDPEASKWDNDLKASKF